MTWIRTKRRKSAVAYISVLSTVVVSSLVIGIDTPPAAAEVPPAQEVTISTFNTAPPIDVVLSKGTTTMNLTNFKNALTTKIANDGYDTSRLGIQEITASSRSVSNSFSWASDRSPAVNNSYGFNNNGASFSMTGNQTLPGKGANWVNLPKNDNTQRFSFSYNLDFGDNFNSAGMLLNVKDNGSYLTGNVLQLGKSVSSGTSIQNSFLGTFIYHKNQNSINISTTYSSPLNIPAAGNLEVLVKKDAIEVFSNGGLAGSMSTPNKTGSGFGFYSDHYAHNCYRVGQFSFNNLQLVETNERTMSQVLQSPTWRDNSYRALVNVADPIESDFLNTDTRNANLVRFLNNGIHYLAWGSGTNLAANQSFVNSNDSNGFALNTTSFTTAVNATAAYIEQNFYDVNPPSDTDYVVIDNPIKIGVSPASAAKDTETEEFPSGSWMLTQDPDYFYNGNGIYANSGTYLSDLPTTVDKTGKYSITYQDSLVKNLYVHRKPTAAFDVAYCSLSANRTCMFGGETVPAGTLHYTTMSTDPDTDPDKWKKKDDKGFGVGIVDQKWEYRYVNQTGWTEGEPPATKANVVNDLIVRLSVKDVHGAWSETSVKTVTDGATVAPIAEFSYGSQRIVSGDKLNIINTSYAPNGLPLNRYAWVLEQSVNGGWVQKGTWNLTTGDITPLKSVFVNGESGGWRYTLTVTNSIGVSSRPYSLGFYVESDATPPLIQNSVAGSSEWYHEGFPMVTTYSDEGTGLLDWGYVINKNATAPGPGNRGAYTVGTSESVTHTIPSVEGVYYLHTHATDRAGNSTWRTFGPYQIDLTAPTGSCKAEWSSTVQGDAQVNCVGTDSTSGVLDWTLSGVSKTGATGVFPMTPAPGALIAIESDKANHKTQVVVTATPAIKLANQKVNGIVNLADEQVGVSVVATNRTPMIYTLNAVTVTANGVGLNCGKTSLTPGESTTCQGNVPVTAIK